MSFQQSAGELKTKFTVEHAMVYGSTHMGMCQITAKSPEEIDATIQSGIVVRMGRITHLYSCKQTEI